MGILRFCLGSLEKVEMERFCEVVGLFLFCAFCEELTGCVRVECGWMEG